MSTETKFTKGEWAILPLEDDKEYIRIRGSALGGRYKVANVIDLKNHHNEEQEWCKLDRAESLANAHLIKTAPKMYKKLEYLNKLLLSLGSEVWDIIDLGAESNSIEELLAQVRGE